MHRITRILAAVLMASALWACDEGGSSSTGDTTDVLQADNALPDNPGADPSAEETAVPDPGAEAMAELPPADEGAEATAETVEELPPTDEGAETTPETTEELPPTDEGGDTAVEDVPATDTASETTNPQTEFQALIAYLEGAGGNYLNGGAFPKVLEATDVMAEGLEAWTILDVRAEDKYGFDIYNVWKKGANGVPDFDEGHIPGAVHVALGDLLTYVAEHLTVDHKILVVCHTGQVAGYAVAALNLLGYDAYSLKWGMAAWNARFDIWSGATSSAYAERFVKTADEGKDPAGNSPTLATSETDPEAILRARLASVLAAPRFVTVADLMAAPEDFYIVNYWPEAEYLDPGHIPGAHQYTPKTSLLTTAFLDTLPIDRKIAVYCYTGQQSAQVAAFLNVLGYEAYSVKFGANAMVYDQLTKQKWAGPVAGPKDFAFEPAAPAVKEFQMLIDHLEGVGGNYMSSTAAPKVIAATEVVAEGTSNYVILDVRAEDKYGLDTNGTWQKAANGRKDYDDGHIPGAIFVALKDVVTYAKTSLDKSQKILVVCHTGQNAGFAVAALNLLGYDAYSLKWGMSAWHTDFDLWSSFTSSAYGAQFVMDPDTGKASSGAYPVLDTGKATATEILEDRLAGVLDAPRFMTVTDLLSAPEDFYIVNYWPEAEYLAPGHVPGAHQYTPKSSLLTTAHLATLPLDQKIAIYCYSGQNSAQVTTFLAALGYDAYSVKFGTNAMIYDQMTKQTWPGPATGPGGYAYEATP